MATTANYGWTTPDDSGLVKDGAQAIRTLGSQIDSSLATVALLAAPPAIPFSSATGETLFTFTAATSVTVAVTFPTTRFTQQPRVFFQVNPAGSAANAFVPAWNSLSSTAMSITLYAPASTTTTKYVYWHAVQQTVSSALG